MNFCSFQPSDLKVYLVSNLDIPHGSSRIYCRVSKIHNVRVKHLISDKEIGLLTFKARKCRLAKEIDDNYIYRHYSVGGCMNSCVLNLMIRRCVNHFNNTQILRKYRRRLVSYMLL